MNKHTPSHAWLLSLGCALALAWGTAAVAQPVPQREKIDLGKSHALAVEIEITNALEAGRVALASNQEDTAQQHFSDAIRLNPARAETYRFIGAIYANNMMRGTPGGGVSIRMDEARQWWRTYLELATDHTDPNWADVHHQLGDFAYSQYRWAHMRDYAHTQLAEAEAHYLRAYEAYIETQRVAKLFDVEVALATIAQIERRYDDAIRYLRAAASRPKAKQSASRTIDLRRFIVLNTIWDGRPEEALEIARSVLDGQDLERLVGREEYLTVTQDILSTAYLKVEEYEQALLYAEMALNVARQMDLAMGAPQHPRTASVQSHIANIYFEMGDLARAEDFYREALANNPNEPIYKNNLAWAIVVRSENLDPRLEEALALSEAAVADYPTAANLDTLAEIYTRLERYDDALDLIERALLMHPGDVYLERQRTRIEEARAGFAVSTDHNFFRLKLWRPPTDANL